MRDMDRDTVSLERVHNDRTKRPEARFSEIVSCAVEWWKMCRPLSYTEEMHCDNPAVNQTGDHDAMLARAVAEYVKTRGTANSTIERT